MSLFRRRKCPIQEHLPKGIHTNCEACQYYKDKKCLYNQMQAEEERKHMRGYPIVVKLGAMKADAITRSQLELAALKYAKFSKSEEEEYWQISQTYNKFWDKATPEQRDGILESLRLWQIYLESDFSPLNAYYSFLVAKRIMPLTAREVSYV